MDEDRRRDNVRRLPSGRRAEQGSAWLLVPSLVIVVAGVWLLLAPTLLRYTDAGVDAASWNDRTVGPAVAVIAVLRLVAPGNTTILSLLNAALGCWLLAAPFALGYDDAPRALRNDLIVGAVIVGLALLTARGRSREGRW